MKEMFGDVRPNTTMCECDFLVIISQGVSYMDDVCPQNCLVMVLKVVEFTVVVSLFCCWPTLLPIHTSLRKIKFIHINKNGSYSFSIYAQQLYHKHVVTYDLHLYSYLQISTARDYYTTKLSYMHTYTYISALALCNNK